MRFSYLIYIFCTILPISAKEATKKPNILFILVDDLGYNDLGCYASKTTLPEGQAAPAPFPEDSAYAAPNQAIGLVNGKWVSLTPKIDHLATQGVRLTAYHAAGMCCTPSRAGTLTGASPARLGHNGIISERKNDDYGLRTREVTIPEALKGNGYATAGYGKWHLGNLDQHDPTRHGFDQFPLSDGADKFGLETITNQLMTFMTEHRDGPFFAYFAPHQPHTPVVAHPDFVGSSDKLLGKRIYLKGNGTTETQVVSSDFHDVVHELDFRVGQILKKLDDLGIAKDTIVIFTSDNGPWHGSSPASKGKPGLIGSGFPYRGGKFDLWEGATRVPALIRYPQVIPAGITSNAIVSALDWFKTLVHQGGGTIPTDRVLDGFDLWPFLTGLPNTKSPRTFDWHSTGLQVKAVSNGEFKLFDSNTNRGNFVSLKNDFTELVDAKTANPEVAASFAKGLTQAKAELASDIRGNQNFSEQEIVLDVGREPYVTLKKGNPGKFTIHLSKPVTSDQIITLRQRSGATFITASPASLTFTAANWNSPQVVTVATATNAPQTEAYATFEAEGSPKMPIREIYTHSK